MQSPEEDHLRLRKLQDAFDATGSYYVPAKSTPGSPTPESPTPLEDTSDKAKSKSVILGFLGGKWTRMVIFGLACFFTAPLYYGWQQYALMLGRSGAYAWLCSPDDILDDHGTCANQVAAISRLYSIAAGCEYASAAWGGLFLDHIGPRLSGFIGEMFWAIGTLMLAFSSESAQMYIPAMIVIGSSVNVVCFPSLVTIETFPEWKGFMVGMMLSAATATTGIPPVMWTLWQHNPQWTFTMIWVVYVLAIWLPVTILYMCALPGARDFQKILRLQRKELIELQVKQINDNEIGPTTPTTFQHVTHSDVTDRDPDLKSLEDEVSAAEQPLVSVSAPKASWREFGKNVRTLDMIGMGGWFFTMMAVYAYYPTVVRVAVGDEVANFLGWFMPTQAVWSLAVGFLCDWFRTPWIMLGMCGVLVVVFSISITGDPLWPHYFAAVILTISQCAIFEVKFTYVSEMFDPFNYGKLVGFLGVLGGLGTFMNLAVSASSNFNAVFISYIAMMPFLMAVAYWLGWRQRRGLSYKTLPDEVPMPKVAATENV